MAKDRTRLSENQIFIVRLLDEAVAAVKYQAFNQRAVEIVTKGHVDFSGLDPENVPKNIVSENATINEIEGYTMGDKNARIDERGKFLTHLVTFPNPAKYKLHHNFDATTGPIKIKVFDVAGKELCNREIQGFDGHFEER